MSDLSEKRASIEAKILTEEAHLKKMVELSSSGTDPETWEQPWKTLFAMAVLPDYPRLDSEHGKGLRLLSSFYKGKNTMERIPAWILILSKQGDRSLVRSAERVRADLPNILWRKKNVRTYR